jgi:hypothetical protein
MTKSRGLDMKFKLRIFWHEVKKIWQLPRVLSIVLLGLLFVASLTGEFINVLDNGFYSADYVPLCVASDLKAEYGGQLSHADRIDAEKFFTIYAADMDVFIENNPMYENAEIFSGMDLWDWRNAPYVDSWIDGEWCDDTYQSFFDEDFIRINSHLQLAFWNGEFMEASDHAWRKLQVLQEFFESYDHFRDGEFQQAVWRSVFEDYDEFSAAEWLFLNAHEQGLYMNLFPGYFHINAESYAALMAIPIVISVGVLLLPTLTRDRKSRMIAMQYSSKSGRRTLRIQFAAGMVSAFVLTAVQIIVYYGIFLISNLEFAEFFNARVFSLVYFSGLQLVNLTFMQFIGIYAAVTLLFSLGVAVLMQFLSLYSRDYVPLLLKALPIVFVAVLVGYFSVGTVFSYVRIKWEQIPIVGFEFILSSGLLIIGIGLCIFACYRAMRKDLLQ